MNSRDMVKYLLIFFSLFLLTNTLVQSSPQRDIKSDIKQCPYLSMINESEWKEAKKEIEHFGDTKDFTIMSAVHRDKEFIFGSQTKHSVSPAWVLLVYNNENKQPLLRFSGYIKTSGYDVKNISISLSDCDKLNLIADIVPEYGIPPTVFGVLYNKIESIKLNKNCDNGKYETLDCRQTEKTTGMISESFYIPRNNEPTLSIPEGDCSEYGRKIAKALSKLYSKNWEADDSSSEP